MYVYLNIYLYSIYTYTPGTQMTEKGSRYIS